MTKELKKKIRGAFQELRHQKHHTIEEEMWRIVALETLLEGDAEKAEKCPTCKGKGSLTDGVGYIECADCNGTGKPSISGDDEAFKALGKVVRTANNEIIAITYEGKQYYPKKLHSAAGGVSLLGVRIHSALVKSEIILKSCGGTGITEQSLYEDLKLAHAIMEKLNPA